MIIIHEEIVKNPNEEVNKLIDDFVKTLKADDIDIKEVSYNDKIIFLNNKADYEYATYLLDHEYIKEKQLGIRVGMNMAPGLNYDIPDPVMMDEDLDRNDDSEEILVENEPDYPEERIEDALRVLGYVFKGLEVDGRLITKYNGKTSYFDDFTDAQDFILNMYLNDKENEEYKWAYDVLVGNKDFDDYWQSDSIITSESVKLNEDDYNEEIQNAIDELQATTSRDLNNVKKRISFTDEFDNGRVIYSGYKWTPEEVELKAREQSLRNPDRIYYVIYDGVGGSNIHWQNGELLLGNY